MNNTSHAERSISHLNLIARLLRNHPLAGYFLIAFALTWLWEILALVIFHLPPFLVLVPGAFVGPTLSAFLMTTLIEGKAGVFRLLKRYILWRVPWRWYLVALLMMPALFLLSMLILPGALTTFQAPTAAFGLSYLGVYLNIFFLGGPLGEEPGWRGFALPRLQQRSGPLLGTLILGVLHGLWHLPLYLLIPGYNGTGPGWLGIGIPFALFVASVMMLTVIFTWVFNNSRSSLLLMMLLHASVNTASQLLRLFPSVAPALQFDLIHLLILAIVALCIIIATSGRLSYKPDTENIVITVTASDMHLQS